MTCFGDVHNKSSIIEGFLKNIILCFQRTHIFVSMFSGNHRKDL